MSLSLCESCVSLPSDIMRYSYPATILKNGKQACASLLLLNHSSLIAKSVC
nr:Uncharacterised protein [Klebsiella pneumoniae]